MKVFVYGSLMSGFGNHRLLEGSEFLGDGKIHEPCRMISFGSFPAIFRVSLSDKDGGPVVGEVYKVDNLTLTALDRLEGNGSFYQRMRADVYDSNNYLTHPLVWVYYLKEFREHSSRDLVPNRDWRAYESSQRLSN
jgi:gamma-glutamylcyclotransferase (GGCT)/AIG2-like uncharacterized protein YtfP